jgi:MFS family permease
MPAGDDPAHAPADHLADRRVCNVHADLDSTIIATALPAIGRSIGESPLRLNVAITCYLLSLAVIIPISGWAADRFAARRVFSAAIIVFTLGSIGCGFAAGGCMAKAGTEAGLLNEFGETTAPAANSLGRRLK